MNDSICTKLTTKDLSYQSSEQYLILCLKLCNLIIKDKCSIEQLIDFNSTILLSHLNSTECHKYSHKESHKMALFVCGAILCVTILLLNSLTLITILKSRRLHSIQNILIANLSISDFLSGVSFMYPCILNLLTINALETYNSSLYQLACMIRQYYYLCLAGYSPMITSMLSSMFTLTLLAFEKYTAILHPYLYERLIHEHQYGCYLCLLLSWAISILVSLLPLMGWNEIMNKSNFVPCMFEKIFTLDYILLFTSICCVCALTMLAIYLRIYFIARKHSKQIAKIHYIVSSNQISKKAVGGKVQVQVQNQKQNQESSLSSSSSTSTCINSIQQQEVSQKVKSKPLTQSLNMNMKAMKTLLILLLGFYVCWLPLIVYFLSFASKSYNNLTIYILMFVACCNAVIDPIVYAFRNQEFLKALLENFKRKSSNSPSTSNTTTGQSTN